jgi:hypothetical protein
MAGNSHNSSRLNINKINLKFCVNIIVIGKTHVTGDTKLSTRV